MPVPGEVLDRLGQLDAPLENVQRAVARCFDEQQTLTASAAIEEVTSAVEIWLDQSQLAEADLLELLPHSEAVDVPEPSEIVGDAVGRLCAISFIHIAVACDVAQLAGLDDADQLTDLVTDLLGDSASSRAIASLVLNARGLFKQLVLPPSRSRAADADPALEMLDDFVRRTTSVFTTVLLGMVPPAGGLVVAQAVTPALHSALKVAPQEIANEISRLAKGIVRLVKLLIHRIEEIIDAVFGRYKETVTALLDALNVRDRLLKRVIRPAADKLFEAEPIATAIKLANVKRNMTKFDPVTGRMTHAHEDPAVSKQRAKKLRDLSKSNRRWVGPAERVAKGVHPLWAVSAGGVPAAPIAAAVILAWVILITGDQLDSRGPFPNFWEGLRTIAG